EGAGPRHLFGWIRRAAGAVAGWQAARVDVEPFGRRRRPAVPRAVEPRESTGGAAQGAAEKVEQEIMNVSDVRLKPGAASVEGATLEVGSGFSRTFTIAGVSRSLMIAFT